MKPILSDEIERFNQRLCNIGQIVNYGAGMVVELVFRYLEILKLESKIICFALSDLLTEFRAYGIIIYGE